MSALVLILAALLQLGPSARDVVVVNGEQTGYIEAIVNGKDYLKVLPSSAGDKGRKQEVVWQAGPGAAISVKRPNRGLGIETVSVIVRYFDDSGRLIGVTHPRNFYGSNASPRWEFKKNDLVR